MTGFLDDDAYIGARAKLLHAFDRGICIKRDGTGRSFHACWCYMAGDKGVTLPCPPEDRSPVVTDVPARGPLFGEMPVPWQPLVVP